ncbi:serine hydrolase domain-containing protein [Nocardioides sp.]|uniref:serine hydrolase domain-containing protein n=1 Tax=Nocardioides sp. TaxID=35761 RepID=UPI0035287590
MRLLLAVLTMGVVASIAPVPPEGTIEEFVARELPASGAPGVAYAVITDGEITTLRGHGVVEKGSTTEVTPDTPFLTGSISKSFTALAVIQLVERGEVDLDTGIGAYVEEFTDQPAGSITVRQLLDHTSGYSTLQGNSTRTAADGADDDLAHRVAGLAADAPAHRPGERWEYSNANYLILGRAVEVVSGQSYQAYVSQHIFEPLGMTHSFVADGDTHDSMATGHTPWFGTKRPVVGSPPGPGTAPAGGVVASAGDLALYLQMMMNGKDDVVTAHDKAQMMTPAGAVSPSYGFGWFLDPTSGTVWHDGSTPGFETLATMEPEERSGVVVLVNAGSGMGFGETVGLRNGITARALGLDDDGAGSALPRQALFLGAALLPLGYLLSIVWAWRQRARIRAKSGFSGLFSLWFPLLTTSAAAWVWLVLVPRLFGAPLSTIRVFSPDFGLALIASGVGGVVWAVSRLAVAYSGRSDT